MTQPTPSPFDDTVQVWRVPLNLPDNTLPSLALSLSPEEQARADRFTFAEGRRRFVATRGSLRKVLGQCLGVDPRKLTFETGAHGKPFLMTDYAGDPNTPQPHPLQFNVSHTDDLAVIAVAWDREVGIDIERLDREVDMVGLAKRFFSTREAEAVLTAGPTTRRQIFFRIWTSKEAYIKARGEGLALPLDQFDVVPDLSKPPGLVATRHDPADAGRWQFAALNISGGHACTLAARGAFTNVCLMDAEQAC